MWKVVVLVLALLSGPSLAMEKELADPPLLESPSFVAPKVEPKKEGTYWMCVSPSAVVAPTTGNPAIASIPFGIRVLYVPGYQTVFVSLMADDDVWSDPRAVPFVMMSQTFDSVRQSSIVLDSGVAILSFWGSDTCGVAVTTPNGVIAYIGKLVTSPVDVSGIPPPTTTGGPLDL